MSGMENGKKKAYGCKSIFSAQIIVFVSEGTPPNLAYLRKMPVPADC